MDEKELKKRLADNPDLGVDEAGSDPRFVMSINPGEKERADKLLDMLGYDVRGPESPLEELLLWHLQTTLPDDLPMPIWGYEFAKDNGRKWRADAAYTEPLNILIEVEGGVDGVGPPCQTCGRRANGGHTSRDGFAKDREKYNAAAIMGYLVLSFTRGQIEAGLAIEQITAALRLRMKAAEELAELEKELSK